MAISTVKKKQSPLLVETINLGSVEVAANHGVATAQLDVSKAGYTPLGIIEISKSGSASGQISITSFDITTANIARVGLKNSSTTTRTVTVSATILYEQN